MLLTMPANESQSQEGSVATAGRLISECRKFRELPIFTSTEMIRKSASGSSADDATDQEWEELEDMEQERRGRQIRKQAVYHQWNNYHNVLLFWRCQEARRTSAAPPTPQAATGSFLVAKNSLSIRHVHKKRGIFTKSSAHSPWEVTETRRELSDSCPKSGQHGDTISFFEALESSADQLVPYEKEAGLLTAKQSWVLRFRLLWLLMALACIAYVMVSVVNVYLAQPLPRPEALPLPILTNHNKEDNSKEQLGKSSESEHLCDWDCLSYLWN